MGQINQIDYLGVICGLLRVRKPITDSFWVNINDDRIPFNGFIEYTNLNQHTNWGESGIVYIPYYLSSKHERFQYSDNQLMREFIDGLQIVNPSFDEAWIEAYHISRARYAQAVCRTGFIDLIPNQETAIDGLYLTDSTLLYPEDRTLSGALRLGRRAAMLIHSNIL
jgi:protoporphyrinogen oxidase